MSREATRRRARVSPARRAPIRRRRDRRRSIVLIVAGLLAVAAVIVVVARRGAGNEEATAVSRAFVGGDLHSLVAVPGDPLHLFVGGHEGVAESRDGGKTWRPVTSLEGADAMGWAFLDGSIWVGGHPGLSVSYDGGKTFTQHDEGLPATDIHAMGGSGKILYAASPLAGVLASEDGGSTWEVRNGAVGGSFMGRILVDPNDTDHVLAPDMQAGVGESLDGGRTWRALGGIPGAMWLSWNPRTPSSFVVSGISTAARTVDGGKSWKPLAVPPGAMIVEMGGGEGAPMYSVSHDGMNAEVWMSPAWGGEWGRP